MLTAAIIFILTYTGIIFTRLPHINIDRPAAVLTGALLMVVFHVMTFSQAITAINFETIVLLMGMMLLLAALQQADFFNTIAARTVSVARSPIQLLILATLITAIASAFLVNDVVVLIFTPIIIHACRIMKINPIPFLLAEAMASNIGSVATIVGNPQNMLIGIISGISFTSFILYLLLVAVVSTIILIAVVYIFYRKQISTDFETIAPKSDSFAVVSGQPVATGRKRLFITLIPILCLTILGLFLSGFIGISIPVIALAGGLCAMLFSGIKPSRLIQGIDWSLLLFFIGLFIVIEGARQSGILDIFIHNLYIQPDATGIVSIHIVSVLVSQIVSNVPLTMLIIPIIQQVPGDVLWISLAAGSTIGGNATIIGAVANIIVVEQAYRSGVKVGWWEFTRVGLVVTVLTIMASIGILILELNLGLLK